jgi:hypothetical protein
LGFLSEVGFFLRQLKMHYIRKKGMNKLRGSHKGSGPTPKIKGRNRKLKITHGEVRHI